MYDEIVDLDLLELADREPSDDYLWESDEGAAWADAAVEQLLAEVAAEGELTTNRPLGTWSAVDLVDLITESEQTIRHAQAQQLTAIAELAQRRPVETVSQPVRVSRESQLCAGVSPYVTSEIALALGVGTRSAENRLNEALTVDVLLPKSRAALSAGVIGMPGLRAVIEETGTLDNELQPEAEMRLLNELGRPHLPGLGSLTAREIAGLHGANPIGVEITAGGATPARIRRLTRRVVAGLDSETARKAGAKALRTRKLELLPGRGDGMAWVGSYVTEGNALAVYDRVDTIAHATTDRDDPRSIDEVRADVFVGLLLAGPEDAGEPPSPDNSGPDNSGPDNSGPCGRGGPHPRPTQDAPRSVAGRSIPVNLQILVDSSGVASAGRLGPIPAMTREALVELAERTGGTVTTRFVQPVTCPGEHSRDPVDPERYSEPYVPPPNMRRSVQLRDLTCVFPGCATAATRCDLDHTVPWPHGPTCPCNLGALCRHHHRLKTHGVGWRLVNHDRGAFTWTTPTGKTYTVMPRAVPP
jgi:Domain of unknown function (DUF222)